jgi:hypothetical protein
MMSMKSIGLGTMLVLSGATLSVAAERREEGKPGSGEREFTLGLVQKEVRIGMSQAELVSALGSPNILTRDSNGREAWVYDRIASEAHFKSSGFAAGGGGLGSVGSSLLLGVLRGHNNSERSTTSQRTLTVVIRFDPDGQVESMSFHATRF